MLDFKQYYITKVRPELKEKLKLSNINLVPKIEKITLNIGVGEAVNNKKSLDSALQQLELIAGQKPVSTMARKSVASFKVREGWPIGCKVTLRGQKMYDFYYRLVHIVLPRVRDFRGMSSKSFDGHGNYNFGVKEQIVFPEIDYDKVDQLRGMDIAITTSSDNDAMARELLSTLNFPFAN